MPVKVRGQAVATAVLALTILNGGTERPAEAQEPPLGRAVLPPLPLPARPPDPVRLAQALALLVGPSSKRPEEPWPPDRALGDYQLLTDIDDPALLERAGQVVGTLEALYVERYGRPPVGSPREAIVLFSSEESYRRFQEGDPRLAGLAGSTGLAGQGVVATYRGERTDNELLGTLVHELAHLLNRRAIGPSLPSWLDEGIADDLGASRIDPAGRLLPGSWSRNLDERSGEIRISGGEAALRDLAALFGPDDAGSGRLDLGAVLALEWEDFVAPENAELHYATAAAFIRMLLASPTRAALFRAWLAEVSAGAPPAAEGLRQRLGRSWEELRQELALWTRAELIRLPSLGKP